MEIVLLILVIALYVLDYFDRKALKEKLEKLEVKPKIVEKQKKEGLSEEQKEKLEQARKHFENLMNYDENVALNGKE